MRTFGRGEQIISHVGNASDPSPIYLQLAPDFLKLNRIQSRQGYIQPVSDLRSQAEKEYQI